MSKDNWIIEGLIKERSARLLRDSILGPYDDEEEDQELLFQQCCEDLGLDPDSIKNND